MNTKKANTAVIISFVAGTAALLFSGGHWNCFVTAFIWPAAYLFCIRNSQKRFFPAVLFAVMTAVNFVKLKGLSNSIAVVDLAESTIVTVVEFLPLLAEHVFVRRDTTGDLWKNPLRALVYPVFYAGLSVLFCLTFISATGSVAYTLGDLAPARRITSVAGIFGLVFLIAWFASLAERSVSGILFKEKRISLKSAAFFVAVLFCVTLAGYLTKLMQPIDHSNSVRIAAAVGIEQPVDEDGEYPMLPFEDSIRSLDATMDEANRQGAEILVYNEEAYCVYDHDAERFVGHACRKAKEYGMYVYLPLDISSSDENEKSENCIRLISPDGQVIMSYIKSRLVPVIETDYIKGDGIIPVTLLRLRDSGHETKAASFICYDGDSPLYINSADRDADILIAPSWDWKGIVEYHTPAMKFRSYENGASLVKVTYDGITAVTDGYGEELLSFNSFETGYDHVESADVPLKGIRTLYGDWIRYLDFLYPVSCVILCFVLYFSGKKRGCKNDDSTVK